MARRYKARREPNGTYTLLSADDAVSDFPWLWFIPVVGWLYILAFWLCEAWLDDWDFERAGFASEKEALDAADSIPP